MTRNAGQARGAEHRPHWRVRLLFGLCVALLVALVLELASCASWRVTEGEWFTYREAFTYRGQHGAESPNAPATPSPANLADRGLERLAAVAAGQVIHPFLGYVYTPEFNQSDDSRMRDLRITDDGFFARRQQPSTPTEQRLRIGVFGGSVAWIFSFRAPELLAPYLEEATGSGELELENYALGGYKQPQQLMTLAWLLARDKAPDVVINLDGFNEVALPRTENLPHGIHPYYPRSWSSRVADVPNQDLAALRGEVAYLQLRRRHLATTFEHPWLRWSVSWNFLWRRLDRRAARRIADARDRLAGYHPDKRPYFAYGPPYEAASDEALVDDLVAIWERSSLAMHELAVGSGIPYYHFLQPNQYVPDSKPLSSRELKDAHLRQHPYRVAVEQAYPRLREAGQRLAARGVAFYDLTQAFANEHRTLYVDSCCHFNALGNRLIAARIGRVLAADIASNRDTDVP